MRILIGVYSRIGQGTIGLYCPSCPGTAHVNKDWSDWNYTIYDCNKCSQQLRRVSTTDNKVLRPPTLDDLKEWAAAMNMQGCMATDEWSFSLPTKSCLEK